MHRYSHSTDIELIVSFSQQPTSSFSTLSLRERSLLLVRSCEMFSSSRALVCSLSSKSRRSFSIECDNIWTFRSSCCSLSNHTHTPSTASQIIIHIWNTELSRSRGHNYALPWVELLCSKTVLLNRYLFSYIECFFKWICSVLFVFN